MSRPLWNASSPVIGSLRRPKASVNHPWAGQMVGVAAASACRRSTPACTVLRRPSRLYRRSRSTPKVSSGTLKPGRNTGGTLCADGGGRSASRTRFHDGGQPLDGALNLRIDRGALTELRDGRLQQLQLCGEFACCRAVAAVLDLQHVCGGLQLRDLRVRAPAQPEPDEHRQREQRERRTDDRFGIDAEAAVDARVPIGKNDRVASRRATEAAWQSVLNGRI